MNENKNCDIVRDLMPLVIDGAASEGSTRLVEAHAAECAECARVLADMRAAAPLAAVEEGEDTHFIRFCKGLERRFRWQKAVAYLALAVVAIGMLAGFGAYARYKMYFDGVPQHLEEDAVEFCIDAADRLVMYAKETNAKHPIIQYQMITEGDVAYVCALRSAWPQLFGLEGENGPMYYDDIRLMEGELRLCSFEYREENDEFGFNLFRHALTSARPLQALRYGTPEDYFTIWERGEPVEIPRLQEQ